MEDVLYEESIEKLFIPSACRCENLGSDDKDESVDDEDTNWLMNEDINWLTERNGMLPLWTRLYNHNCVEQLRKVAFEKENNYEVEIPGRLLSLFSNSVLPTPGIDMNLKKLENYQLISNVLALCSALKYNFRDWSHNLLDTLIETPVVQYPKILRQLSLKDEDFRMEHLNQSYIFKGDEYKVKIQEAQAGYIYMQWDSVDVNYNLSRALHWFFDYYQFGLLKCCNRTLAFGHALDNDYGFFMYDCQSQGYPLFKDHQSNSYILRANHLQVLLYCLIITLNVTTENIPFLLYSVDIKILNPMETLVLEKVTYVPTIKEAAKKNSRPPDEWSSNESNDNSFVNNSKGIQNNNNNNNTNNANNQTSDTIDNTKAGNLENVRTPEQQQKLTLDSDKMYYVVAVPKKSNPILEKANSMPLSCLKVKSSPSIHDTENITVNIHRVTTLKPADNDMQQTNGKFIQECTSERLNLIPTSSTETLIPLTADQVPISHSSSALGLKVYLVNNSTDPTESSTKIQTALKLRDLLT